ncbi:MAG: transcription elongation factor GreA [Patescibacteria group bacterium]
MDRYYLTQERFDELKRELEELKSKKRIEVAERLKTAKEFGDLSENSEYTEAREEQSIVEGRIFELEELMKRAEIIKKSAGAKSKVEVGSSVTVKKGEKVATYTIVGAYDADPATGKISDESPLGRAFLGRRPGDKATVEAPSGEAVYEVLKIE